MKNYQHFIDTLITLKSYYQQQVEEYSRLASEAREQLNHVDALLFDQLQRQYKQQSPDSLQTEATNQTKAIASQPAPQNISPPELSAIDLNSDLTKPPEATEQRLSDFEAINPTEANAPLAAPPNTSPLFSPKVELDSGISDPAIVQAKSDLKESILPLTTDSVQDEQPSAANTFNESLQAQVLESGISLPIEQAILADADESLRLQGMESGTTNETNNLQLFQDLDAASREVTTPSGSRGGYTAPLKTPLLPSYQHLSKSEAVENFLQSNEGKTFHIDEITRALHGDLGDKAIEAERSRMYDTLRKGAARGLWSAVPNSPNYYTIDLNSLEPTPKQQELSLESPLGSTTTRRSKYSNSLLPRYRQMGLSQAIEAVVQENAGEILTPERVTRDLFGEISQTTLTKAQEQVSKRLRDGAKLGLWQRVPGQLAQYLLDLK
jgi:hypothetical protein